MTRSHPRNAKAARSSSWKGNDTSARSSVTPLVSAVRQGDYMTEGGRRSIGGFIAAGKQKLHDRRVRQASEAREAVAVDARQCRQDGDLVYFRTIAVSTMADWVVADRIALIEAEGWRLESSSYVYVPDTSWTNTSDDSSSTSHRGQVQGHFVFRQAPIPDPAPAVDGNDRGAEKSAPDEVVGAEVVDEPDEDGSVAGR